MLPLKLIERSFGSDRGSAIPVSSISLMGLRVIAFVCQVKITLRQKE